MKSRAHRSARTDPRPSERRRTFGQLLEAIDSAFPTSFADTSHPRLISHLPTNGPDRSVPKPMIDGRNTLYVTIVRGLLVHGFTERFDPGDVVQIRKGDGRRRPSDGEGVFD